MKLTIERSRWLRGGLPDQFNDRSSYLLRQTDGKMCCLGFLAVACGLTEVDITNKADPCHVDVELPYPFSLLIDDEVPVNSYVADQLITVNDERRPDQSEADRETEIKQLMREIDVEVEFVD